MSGMGLTAAFGQYQNGLQDFQRNEQVDRLRKQQALGDEAEKAFGSVIEASQAEAIAAGQDISKYRPSDATMLKAAERRGIVLAKGGDWKGYLTNEAAVQKQRIRVRAQALQKHEADGNTEDLLRAVVPTIFDGNELTKVETIAGGPPGGLKGAPSGPPMIRFTMSNGVTKMMEPKALLDMVKMTLIDPEKMAQQEIEANYKRMLSDIEADKQIKVGAAKGKEDRETERLRAEGRQGLADTRGGYQVQAAEVRGDATKSAAATRAGATVEAAGLRAANSPNAGGRVSVKSSYVNAAGDRVQQLRDGTTVNLGKDRAYQSMLSREIADLKKTEFGADPKKIEAMAAANIAARAARGGTGASGGGKVLGLSGSGTAPKVKFLGMEN